MPKKIPAVTPTVGKGAPAAQASNERSPASMKAPTKGQAKKQATAAEKSNVRIGPLANTLIGKDLAPTRQEGVKAGRAVKEVDVSDQRAGQAKDTVVRPAIPRSAQKIVPTSPEVIESAVETQAIKKTPKEKHSSKVNSFVKAPLTASSSSECDTRPSTKKGVVEVQFRNPYLALQKVQSFSGSKPTGWIPARKIQDSKAFGVSNLENLTTQIRLMSPVGSVTDSSHSSSSGVTQGKTLATQDAHILSGLNSAKAKSIADGLSMAERLVDGPTSQMSSEMDVNKFKPRQHRYRPFSSQNPYPYSLPNMGLSSLESGKTSHDDSVNSRWLAKNSTDQMPLAKNLDPVLENLELIGESDDPHESPWARNYELAEVGDCPFEGFEQARPQGIHTEDNELFSDTLFSIDEEGYGSTFREPYSRVSQGYLKILNALMTVEKMADSSILKCHLRIMRNEISVLVTELRLSMHVFRKFRRIRVEFDRILILNTESQELLLWLVGQERVTAPFDDYLYHYEQLVLQIYDLERYYIYRSGSYPNAKGTMRASISRSKAIISRGKTLDNISELAIDLWQICDEGYGTQSRKQFDYAEELTGTLAGGLRNIQKLCTRLTDYWRHFAWLIPDYQVHREFREKAMTLSQHSTSMQPYFYVYQSIALRRSMEMAANAATSHLIHNHTDVSGPAQAAIHQDWLPKNRRRVQQKPIQKVARGASCKYRPLKGYDRVGKNILYRRVELQSLQNKKYHTIQTSSYSGGKLPSTPDPNGSSMAVRENDSAGVASNTNDEFSMSDGALSTNHGYLNYQIPGSRLREAMLASRSTGAAYWQYSLYEDATGKKPRVHYCKTMEATERIAQLFLGKEVVGFDIEWKPGATPTDGIKNNVSLVQLASEERIALFHIARYGKDGIENLVSPTLRQIMEDPNITKVGVSVKADCTRLRKFMEIQSRGLFELSHLYKLVRYSDGNVKKIDKRLVALAQQVEEHLQLPMWKGEVRSSDWTEDLSYQQIQYAASDSYAGLQLYDVMEGKRKALFPRPPRPEHAELNLSIRLANGQTVATYDEPEEVSNENPTNDDGNQPVGIEEMARDFLNIAIEDSEGTQPLLKSSKSSKPKACPDKAPEIIAAEEWIQQWRATLPSDYKAKATPAYLRAYFLWHYSDKDVLEAASILRDPPLQASTVSNYILEAVRIEKLPFDAYRLPEVLAHLPPSLAKGKYQSLRKLAN